MRTCESLTFSIMLLSSFSFPIRSERVGLNFSGGGVRKECASAFFGLFICVPLLPCLDYLPSYDLLMSMTGGGFSACCLSTFDLIWGVEQWLAPLFGVCPSGSCLEFCPF